MLNLGEKGEILTQKKGNKKSWRGERNVGPKRGGLGRDNNEEDGKKLSREDGSVLL